jgi:hypothetical protein
MEHFTRIGKGHIFPHGEVCGRNALKRSRTESNNFGVIYYKSLLVVGEKIRISKEQLFVWIHLSQLFQGIRTVASKARQASNSRANCFLVLFPRSEHGAVTWR